MHGEGIEYRGIRFSNKGGFIWEYTATHLMFFSRPPHLSVPSARMRQESLRLMGNARLYSEWRNLLPSSVHVLWVQWQIHTYVCAARRFYSEFMCMLLCCITLFHKQSLASQVFFLSIFGSRNALRYKKLYMLQYILFRNSILASFESKLWILPQTEAH